MVKSRFNDDRLVTVPMHLSVSRLKERGILYLWIPELSVLPMDFEVSLLPAYVGELVISTARPVYDWREEPNPARIQIALRAKKDIALDRLPGMNVDPEPGNQRYEKDRLTTTCGPIQQNAWKLFDGEIVLDSDDLVQKGWTTPLLGWPTGTATLESSQCRSATKIWLDTEFLRKSSL
jgi:hypothetical protein